MSDESPVSDRVQIVPLGFEYDRLMEPIINWKADVVVPIEYNASNQEIPYLEAFIEELAANPRIELDRRSCDIFDLYDALGTISKAISDYAGNEVFVNLSGGSKITAIGSMIACMATGARPIYARPLYGPEATEIPDEPLHQEVREIFELPRYPIDRPSDIHLAFLSYIDSETTNTVDGRYRGVSKKELIEFARDRKFRFISESESTTRKGYYRLLDRHVIAPLREQDYVNVEKIGRKKFVTLSEDGQNALGAFRFSID